jgi:hypothetical protein
MEILRLTLRKKWFDMILSGEKKTEYRELKPYWAKRLFDYKSIDATPQSFLDAILQKKYPMFFYMKRYTHIQFYNGAYFSDKLPNFVIEFKGLHLGKGVEDWGAEKDVEYFCLELGEIIK